MLCSDVTGIMSTSTSNRDLWVCQGGLQHREVPLVGIHLGEYFLVSVNDYDRVMLHSWRIIGGYPCATIDGRTVSIQQFITERDHSDHISRDRLDNRRGNLFRGGQAENNRNRDMKNARTTSVYPGVNWKKQNQKWRAEIRIEGKKRHLGLFANELEAAYTYYKAARKQHPYMNFPAWEASSFQEYILQQEFSTLNV